MVRKNCSSTSEVSPPVLGSDLIQKFDHAF